MQNQWVYSGSEYRMREISHQLPALPAAVYKVQEDKWGFYMIEVSKQFALPEKVYGVQRPFIDRVKRSWANTKGNMGILLNGIRGTGKTVTAEMICNELNLPVLIISQTFENNVTDFINELQDDCIIFIDEYDKIYEKYSSALLTVMDGVLKRNARIMFLLTTNDDRLNENMYQRPSRIRYIKGFGNLDPDVVVEIIDDKLQHPELRQVTIDFISELSIITIDLVQSIIEEVNIHQESPYEFGDIFNINGTERTFKVTQRHEDGTETVLFQKAVLDDMIVPFVNSELGSSIYINGRYQGNLREIFDPSTVEVSRRIHKDDEEIDEVRTLHFEQMSRKHYSFINKGL